ncbi:MAG TPA: hypothetical protein VNP91_09155 [Methylomirabilota bacterium]|nr:hypothetical protein [Methylomirabilota bacterium]
MGWTRHLERLAEENRSGSRASDDLVARKQPLAESLHHVSRTHAVERLAEVGRLAEEVELEIRSPRGRVRPLTETKTLELFLTGFALAQMRFQRHSLGEPDVRVEERRKVLASVLAVHGNRHPQPQYLLDDT